jgi:hypothetical protein
MKRLAHANTNLGPAPPRIRFHEEYDTIRVWPEHDIFSPADLNALLYATLHSVSLHETLRRVADREPLGRATAVIADYGTRWTARNNSRWDISLSEGWVRTAAKANPAFQIADANARAVRKTMPGCKSAKVHWHAMLVRPGSPDQDVHDDAAGKKCYYTYIVPLTSAPRSGGTYFPGMNLTFQSFGGAVLFGGDVLHKGLGNHSQSERVFLFAAIYTGRDPNEPDE